MISDSSINRDLFLASSLKFSVDLKSCDQMIVYINQIKPINGSAKKKIVVICHYRSQKNCRDVGQRPPFDSYVSTGLDRLLPTEKYLRRYHCSTRFFHNDLGYIFEDRGMRNKPHMTVVRFTEDETNRLALKILSICPSSSMYDMTLKVFQSVNIGPLPIVENPTCVD